MSHLSLRFAVIGLKPLGMELFLMVEPPIEERPKLVLLATGLEKNVSFTGETTTQSYTVQCAIYSYDSYLRQRVITFEYN